MNITPTEKNFLLFAGLTLGIFTVTYTTLLLVGLTPKQFQADISGTNIFQVVGAEFESQIIEIDTTVIPESISIPKIGVDSRIHIPPAVDVATLDAVLQKGAVYYPGSGTLQSGNMFLFGHSTNWQVVNNEAYRTFNGLDKLMQGDEIYVYAQGKTYVYTVMTTKRVSENDTVIEFDQNARMLTISTCDTFGRKQDRWVTEALFDRVI